MAAVTALVAAGAAVVGSGVQAISANQRAQKAKGKVGRAKQELQALEDSRQEIINPYDNQKSVTGITTLVWLLKLLKLKLNKRILL